jgi:hypothetical protein
MPSVILESVTVMKSLTMVFVSTGYPIEIAKSAHPEVVEVAPKESPNSEKAKVDIPPKPDGPSSHAKPYEYPLERVPMPHMNPSSGAPPILDEFNYSY